ncbi:MAG TPA: HypC/HybG/HupF family hydrogenase formation chaperone [Terriglobales bacterium]|nr:HypC/HybG/HupF family hydrogenase formation chaperone [Terriglobales bacterium]
MCLGVPVKIIQIKGNEGVAEFKGVRKKINLELLENVKKGDYVILHAGFAIQKMEPEEALETLKLFEELSGFENE